MFPTGTGQGAADDDARAALRAAVVEFGTEPVAFLALESGMQAWFDEPTTEGTGACVAYVDTGTAWVAVGGPFIQSDAKARAAERFVARARERGRRACFFAADFDAGASREGARRFNRLLLGERPILRPAEWLRESAPKVREQLRRARAKHVRVRRVEPDELAQGRPLRRDVDRLAADWLASRHIEPMSFLVAVEPYHEPALHRYFVAERNGQAIAFVSVVPFRSGWLVEDVFRGRDAPNGTTELLIEAVMRDTTGADVVTLGLTPLSGPVAWPLRATRRLMRPLFDFEGLRRFRERMRPQTWQPVHLVYPRGELAAVHVIEILRAFAGGSLIRFAVRSLARRPSGPPWVLAVLLVPWTIAVALMAVLGVSACLGLSRAALVAFAAFDVAVIVVLFRAALAPKPARLIAAALLAAADAVVSVIHLAAAGWGDSPVSILMRAVATLAPTIATVALALTAHRATGILRERHEPVLAPSR